MGLHDPPALHDEGPWQAARRKGAAAAAGHLGDEAAARRALDDADAGVRAAAVGALVRLGSLASPDLERARRDPSPLVRRRLAEVAWRAGLTRAALVELAMTLLSDEAGEVVEAACFCLGELQAPEAAGALATVASAHHDALCRESAVAALGAIAASESLPVILAALEDRAAVRRRAVLALASYSGPLVDAALEHALSDRDWQVRQAAEDLTSERDLPPPGRAPR
ncbi:MAG TPA: HEAT repeat domain-containing protein [Acidimicrobiales bacterium]|nr:HEAT repeat domain-containing protein [Acidimicrobiales bacterium]